MSVAYRACSTRRARILVLTIAFAAAFAVAVVAAGHAAAARSGSEVGIGTTSLGPVLVDAHGRTLYMFAVDKHGKSSCSGQCAAFWPPLLTATRHVTGSGVEASLLGTTARPGGKLQITYHGHPLYRFAKDTKAGETNGQALVAFGGAWWVLSSHGTPVKHAVGGTNSTTTTGGGGYHP